jgi:hypothetical protein
MTRIFQITVLCQFAIVALTQAATIATTTDLDEKTTITTQHIEESMF